MKIKKRIENISLIISLNNGRRMLYEHTSSLKLSFGELVSGTRTFVTGIVNFQFTLSCRFVYLKCRHVFLLSVTILSK